MEIDVKEAKEYTIVMDQKEKKILLRLMELAGTDPELIENDFTEDDLIIATKMKVALEKK